MAAHARKRMFLHHPARRFCRHLMSAAASRFRPVAITASGTAPLLVQSGVGTPVITYGQQQTQIQTKITSLTVVPLDVGTVATGGTAVTALASGHATAGGFVGTSNAAGICVDQYQTAGTVTGTPSTTWCVYPGQPYALVPSTHAVSVNSTASGVSIVGEGLQ